MQNSKKTRFQVGIPTGIKRPAYYTGDDNLLEVHEIANIQEHGTLKGIPPRPVFKDTFSKTMKGKVGLTAYIERAIKKVYAVKGIIVSKTLR
jgi:hypothetical protein